MSKSNAIHVVGCNVWSDYSADVLFDDGTAMCFGAGLDAFVRAGRVSSSHHASSSSAYNSSVAQQGRLSLDMQLHYTSHALSKDIAHVGAALKVISTVCPRPKFLRVAVKAAATAATGGGGGSGAPTTEDCLLHWKSTTVTLEEFTAPALDDPNHVTVNPDGSVTVTAVGGNASLWFSANGAYFDVTWPARAFESDGRSIQFVHQGGGAGEESFDHHQSTTPGINTVKSILCVPHQQRFPTGLAVDAARRCKAPAYREDGIDQDFWAPLACWAPLLRVAAQTWKNNGGFCPESLLQFLASTVGTDALLSSSSLAASEQRSSMMSAEHLQQASTRGKLMDSIEVTGNFPPPIPPKVSPVISAFPKLSMEDAATLLASTAERLHSLPIHDRVHPGGALCVSWAAGERAVWLSPEPGIARSLIFEDMSCLHVEGLVPNAPMALLHILNAVKRSHNQNVGDDASQHHDQQQRDGHATQEGAESNNSTAATGNSSILQSFGSLSAAAKVYSWETGSRDRTARHAPMLPACVIVPSGFMPCSAPDAPLFLSREGRDNDPRRGRYLANEVECMASIIQIARTSAARAALHAPISSSVLGVVPANRLTGGARGSAAWEGTEGMNQSTMSIMKQRHGTTNTTTQQQQQQHQHNQSLSLSMSALGSCPLPPVPGEGVGAVMCSSTIPDVGVFTAYQDGTVRCCFNDRTILSLRPESVEPTCGRGPYFSGEDVFVTALDSRAVSTRFRAAACGSNHPMHPYLQYALPFLRYANLPSEERHQLAEPVSLTTCASDFGREQLSIDAGPAELASQLERVVARTKLDLMKHQEMSQSRRQLLDRCGE